MELNIPQRMNSALGGNSAAKFLDESIIEPKFSMAAEYNQVVDRRCLFSSSSPSLYLSFFLVYKKMYCTILWYRKTKDRKTIFFNFSKAVLLFLFIFSRSGHCGDLMGELLLRTSWRQLLDIYIYIVFERNESLSMKI